MTMTLSERVVGRFTGRSRQPTASRRGFLGGAALVGAAIAVDPWGFLVRPANAYDAVCGNDAGCNDGYSVFCCTINNGNNSCPPNTFVGGWWKADNSSFCGGNARYYVDCNAFAGGPWQCRCAEGTCDQRRVACNQFRYGQCRPDVSAAQTGPVVCRVVSCTPPWQQFADSQCSSASLTDNRTVSHTAPCLAGTAPVGSLELVSATGEKARIRGWAYDPDEPATAVPVALYVDGAGVGWYPTGGSRTDVNQAFGISGNHGFDFTVGLPPGQHSVTIYAGNVAGGSGDTYLGSKDVATGRKPLGHLDSTTAVSNGIRLKGWAFDPDEPATEINVAVYRDGQGVKWFPTGSPRSDVNSVYGITGRHGFDITIPATPGSHTVAVYAINIVGGSGNPLVGQGAATVSALPKGHLDRVTVVDGMVRVAGWAYDPDEPATEIKVAVYRDGKGIKWFPTGVSRPDVNRVYGITGNHGFDIRIAGTTSGQHTFAVYAINVGPAAGNPLIGTSSVQVP